jgi:hypothetical protein
MNPILDPWSNSAALYQLRYHNCTFVEKDYMNHTIDTNVPSILVIVAPHIRLRIIYFWIYVNYTMTPFALKLFILVLPT